MKEFGWSDLPLEIRILVAGQDNKIFSIVRAHDPEVRKFTNERIEEYKNKFVREIINGDRRCYMLPNGNKHGPYEQWNYAFGSQQLKFRFMYRDNIRDGLFNKWYSNGQLEFQLIYKDGKEHGWFCAWYDNGQLKKRLLYNNGVVENGVYYEWYDSGSIYSKYEYKNGEFNGLYQEWFESGQLWKQYNLKDGIVVGLYQVWYPDGRLKKQFIYRNESHDVNLIISGMVSPWKAEETIYI